MERSDLFGLLLDQSQDKIALLDEAGTFTYVNAAAERILGFEPDDLVGESAFEFVHPEDLDTVREEFYRTVRSDSFREGTIEYRHRASDGWVWLESRMSNLTHEKLDGYVVSSRDVTDRVQAEREQAETATRLEGIAAVSGDVLWMFDADWSELLFVNPAYEEIFGEPTEAVYDDPSAFLDAVHPQDRPAVEDAMRRIAAGESVEMEYRVNPEEEYKRWVWVQGEPITQNGEVVRVAGFARDITERRRRERQLVVMDNLLRHTLRNDLNVVLGQADLIDDEFPEAAARTEIIHRVGNQLLKSAEKEREIIDLLTDQQWREPVDIRQLVVTGVETVRERYPDCVVEVGTLEPAVVQGRPELEQAITELLENAVQHCEDANPGVQVRLRQAGDDAELVIEDGGEPIPAIEADVLTGDHDEMTNVYHSSGLGFWLVYWAVELSNGEIDIDAPATCGNRITVSLPLARDDEL
jgi:PAS domain S-box-containing protein